MDDATKSHALVCDRIENLGETPWVIVDETPDRLAFMSMLRETSNVYDTCDLTEEYVACHSWPLKSGWTTESWLLEP